MRHVTYFHKKTGLLHAFSHMVSDDAAVALNTPPGHEAIDHPREKMLDPISQRVDVATGKVIDYQPPQPSVNHKWDAGLKRWRLTTAAQAALNKERSDAALLQSLREQQHDPVRRLTLDPADIDARKVLQQIDAQITALK